VQAACSDSGVPRYETGTRSPVSGMNPEGALRLGYSRFERGAEGFAHRLQLDAVEHVLEEAAHDQPLRLGARQAARHQVEDLFAIDAAERGAVRAAHVVRHDLETRDRIRMRLVGEQQVAVLLVRVRLLRALLDTDHPAPQRGRLLAPRALEREVALRARRGVLLERVVVEMLIAVGEVGAGHPRRRAGTDEVVLDPDLAALRAEPADHPVELAVALEARAVTPEVPRLLAEVLQRDALDLRVRRDEQLDDRVRVAERVGAGGREILDHREPRALLGLHDHAP